MANTIQDKLAYLEETKGLIKEAIVAKGVSVSDSDTFRSYANKITSIQSGGGSIAGAPSGIKFNNSTFTTVPTEIIPYLEAQTDLSGIFENCENLTTVPQFAANHATSMQRMFYNCSNLQKVSQISTPIVTTMNNMFYLCKNLQKISLFDTKNVNDMSYMFRGCESLATVPDFNTSRVTNMEKMFNGCINLAKAPLLDTRSVVNMDTMFAYCTSLATASQFNTISVTNMNYMFMGCSKLQTIPLLNVSSVTEMSYMLYDCKSLTNLGGFTGLKLDLDLSSSPLLTVDSVMNVITAAADMTSSPKTLTLHQDTFNKLTEEQIATATAKGWNIASNK